MSNYIITNGELYHSGVKGMKWGVRKAVKKTPPVVKKIAKKAKPMVEKGAAKIAKSVVENRAANNQNNPSQTRQKLKLFASRGQKYATSMLTSTLAGVSVGVLTNAVFRAKGKHAVSNLLIGAAAGSSVGAIQVAKKANRDMHSQ